MNRFKDLNFFPMGFWNYTASNTMSPKDVSDWKQLGMSVIMSPEYREWDSKENMLSILDECEKNNMKVIMCDYRSYWQNLKEGEDYYRKVFFEAVQDFGSHPAVISFIVGDEPTVDTLDLFCKAYNIQKEIRPDFSPFINLLGWSHEQKALYDLTGYTDWEAYLENFYSKTHCDLLCYDIYYQMNPNKEYWDTYFANLNYYNKVAKAHNIPWWTTLLSVGHFRYQCPTIDDFRWQINSAVAHGAKGLLWFYIYQRWIDTNYRYAPINEFEEKTLTYEQLSYEIRRFRRQFEGVIEKLDMKKVFHVGKSYGNTPLFTATDFVINVYGENKTEAIVSFFNDDYVAVINNDNRKSDKFFIEFTDDVKKVLRISDHGEFVENYPTKKAYYDIIGNRPTLSMWLAPGGMEIYKIIREGEK